MPWKGTLGSILVSGLVSGRAVVEKGASQRAEDRVPTRGAGLEASLLRA